MAPKPTGTENTTSTPWVRESKSLVKKRNSCRPAALVIPSLMSCSRSESESEKSCETVRRSFTLMSK